MKDILKFGLHCVRVLMSYVPGGQMLSRVAMDFVGGRSHKRQQMLLQNNGMAVCGRIHEVLSAAGISYFADHGTLLGFIRENGLIKHDLDMDFSIPPQESIKRVYEALSAAGFEAVHGFSCNDEVQEITVSYQGVSVDFFKCHLIENDLGHYVFCSKYDQKRGALIGVMAHERRRPPLKGLEIRQFGVQRKVDVSIPVNAIEYLEASYGNWRVPDSKTDFSSDKIPTQYRDVLEGCRMLDQKELIRVFEATPM